MSRSIGIWQWRKEMSQRNVIAEKVYAEKITFLLRFGDFISNLLRSEKAAGIQKAIYLLKQGPYNHTGSFVLYIYFVTSTKNQQIWQTGACVTFHFQTFPKHFETLLVILRPCEKY